MSSLYTSVLAHAGMSCMYVLRSRALWQGLGMSKSEAGVIARTYMPVGRWLGWESSFGPLVRLWRISPDPKEEVISGETNSSAQSTQSTV